MSNRALGCGLLAIVVFVALGVIGLNMATTRVACPSGLQWSAAAYRPEGAPAGAPSIPGSAPAEIGTTLIGLTSRKVYAAAGTNSSDPAAARPARISLECGDGTYQTYVQAP